MSYLREQDDYRDHHHDETYSGDTLANKEHELTLSSAAIFGIFFGQVVLCGIFFGFGYSMGGHRSTGPETAETSSSTVGAGADFSGFKPAAGQPVGAHSEVAVAPATVSTPIAASTPAPEPVKIAPATTPTAVPTVAPVVRVSPPLATAAPKPTPVAATPAPQGLWVQVAAISVSHAEDATLLQNALRAKGYSVSQHPGPDNFIHLLLGPFNDRSSADTMRQRLATDGYTAYIK
jgi:cell division septation protein DedD